MGKKMNLRYFSVCCLLAIFVSANVWAQEEADKAAESNDAQAAAAMMALPYCNRPEPPIYMQADGYDWDHEINVVLPVSYATSPEKKYPVLWIMDGTFHLGMTADMARYYAMANHIPEIIVVAVGHRPTETMAEFIRKRTVDLFFKDSTLIYGPAKDFMKDSMGLNPDEIFKASRGDEFLDFLIDDVRPALAKKYRMADDHALFGHSAGGGFTSRAVFERPGAFKRFIIGSGTDGQAIVKEAEYAKTHDDMDARIFVGAGDMEVNDIGMSAQRIVSNPVLLAENLRLRQYKSLDLEVRLYRDKDHATVVPLTVSDGLIFIYKDLMEANAR